MSDLDGDLSEDQPSQSAAPNVSERKQAAQGGRWGVLSAICEQGGSILATVVLARLLTPEDFGVVAAATVVLNLIVTFGQVGLDQSLVRRDDIEEPVSSSIFWAATGLGAFFMVVCMLLAPVFARLLKQPDITLYVVALAPLLLITMVSSVSRARLLRELRFRWVYTADITNIVIYTVLTVGFAAAGMGAWSMVWGRVAGEFVAAAVRFISAGWRPRWIFSKEVIRSDLRFNGHLLLNGQLSFFSKNIDYWAVSRSLGAEALGTYYVAFVLPNILRQRITWLSSELTFPLLARAKSDRDRLVAIWRESTEVTSALAIPILTGIALTAPEIIRIAFGPQWAAAVGPMRWLSVGAMFDAVSQGIVIAFIAIGKPGLINRSNVVRLVAMAVGLVAVLQVSTNLTTVAGVVTIAGIIGRSTLLFDMKSEFGVGPLTIARWIGAVLVGAAAMIVAVLLVASQIQDLGVILRAVIEVVVGAVAFGLAMFLTNRTFTMKLVRTGKEIATGRR